MNRLRFGIVLLTAALCAGCARKGAECVVIPRPVSVEPAAGAFRVGDMLPTVIDAPDSVALPLAAFISTCPLPCSVSEPTAADAPSGKGVLRIELSDDAALPRSIEGYTLSVHPQGIIVRSRGGAGLFYGVQTLLQLYDAHSGRIPSQEMVDSPRFAWRGLHLDVSRHFFDKAFDMKQMRMMAALKLNRLHLHLTDGAGWRLAIDRYPQLAERAAWRIGRTWQEWQAGGCRYAHEGDADACGGYYTREDIRELTEYAAALHITIVPEIEMPAHSEEVLALFPELSCTGKGGTGDFCIGNEGTFEFLENVLSEVMEMFPSEYIHIGGDEAAKTAWAACPKCRARMAREGLANVDELQGYAVRRMERFLKAHGRRLIGWDEILDGGATPEAVVMSWRSEDGGRTAAAAGHDVVMTPGAYCYFDGYQDDPTSEPQAFSGYLPLEKVYGYDPAPADMPGRERVAGVQANLWTEYIPTPEQAEYMLYPRAFALSEVAWSPAEGKDYADFRQRALRLCSAARAVGYNTFDLAAERGERRESLAPDKHIAVGCPVAFATPWSERYPAAGAATLTDGVHGKWSYGERWLGFVDSDMDATVDLGSVRQIHEVSADFIQWYSAWVWLPSRVEISVSDDGGRFRTLCTAVNDYPEEEHRPAYRAFGWKGSEQARYVRYRAYSNGRPGGWLFTDEITIN